MFWFFLVVYQLTFPFTQPVLRKSSVASFHFNTEWSDCNYGRICKFVASRFKFWTCDICNINISKSVLLNVLKQFQEKLRHKRSVEVVGICNGKKNVLKNWDSEKSCKHVLAVLQTSHATVMYFTIWQYWLTSCIWKYWPRPWAWTPDSGNINFKI